MIEMSSFFNAPQWEKANTRQKAGTMFSGHRQHHFVWKENSKTMHDKIIEASPFLVRQFTRNGIDSGLEKHGCGDVTEAIMYDVVKEVTPPKYLEASLKILDEYRTTTAGLI